jgi:hypothetical protein
MRKRISLLIVAVIMALSMVFGGAGAAFADPNCDRNPDHPNCELVGPGESETTPAAGGGNPNIQEEFQPPGRTR